MKLLILTSVNVISACLDFIYLHVCERKMRMANFAKRPICLCGNSNTR